MRRKKLLTWREVWLKYVTPVPLDLRAINTNKYTLSSVPKGFVGVLLLFKLIFIGIRYLVQKRSKRNTRQSQETAFLCKCTTALSWGGSDLLPYFHNPAVSEGSCTSKTIRTALRARDLKQTNKQT